MMNKLIVLVLALAIAAPAVADDLIPAPFRNEPGSTYSHWTYNDPCGVYDFDPPESSWYVEHPDKEPPGPMPYWDPCSPYFSMQVWGSNDDPCAPVWYDNILGRQGVIDFAYGSWDMQNFVHDQPAKDLWVQITYFNGTEVPTEFGFGAGSGADPCAEPSMGAYEGPDSTWPSDMEIMWSWMEPVDPCDPCGPQEQWNGFETGLDEWDPAWPDPTEEWGEEPWFDGERISSQVLGDGWLHDVWVATMEPNPDFEWWEGGWAGNVLIDQIVIETLCYVPEPATMVLLGLGSLLMIRRKK